MNYKQLILKNIQLESQQFTDRVIVSWLGMILLIVVLVGHLIYLQVFNYEHYSMLSEKNRLDVRPIPPIRGLIYDRNGIILAKNITSYRVEMVPEQVPDMSILLQRLTPLLQLTANELDGLQKRLLRKKLQHRNFDRVLIRDKLSPEEVASISVYQHRLEGVYIDASLTRFYPFGEHAAHVIGYVGRINEQELKRLDEVQYKDTEFVGKTGIERHYEPELHGEVGYKKVVTNAQGRILQRIDQVNPVAGKDLYLNLDIDLQIKVEGILANERAALVAIEPKTGAVLAMASMPTFDPNLFVNGIDHAAFNELRLSPDRPLYNRAVRGLYSPGSSIKPFVGLAGFEYGVRKPTDHSYCRGYITLKNNKHKYRCWIHKNNRGGHGAMDFNQAVEQSCDVYFYELALDLGIDNLSEFLNRFSFGRKTGIDTFGELAGLMPTKEWKTVRKRVPWYPGETAIAGIGQGYTLSTPIQLATATALISMKGQGRKPHLVSSIKYKKEKKTEFIASEPMTVAVKNPATWDEAIHAMRNVLHGKRGTARDIMYGSSYQMAGKTGTVQVVKIKQNEKYDASKLKKEHQDHAWFVAFAPIDNPRIALAVIVENGGSGSHAAAPLAKQVIDYYLKKQKVIP